MKSLGKDIQISVEKIDFEDLIKDFKVLSIDTFTLYLKELWKDLSERSDDKHKGINKVTFAKYYVLPGIISDRLFAVFDKNKNDCLDLSEFIDGMSSLFSESFDKMEKFIFNFYDFDKDGIITKEDVRIVLSYIPLNLRSKVSSVNRLKYEQEDYKDRVESQDELYTLLENCFKGVEKMDFAHFSMVIEKILIFLLEKKPFSKNTLEEFKTGKPTNNLKVKSSPSNRLIASPNMQSKFSPSVTICKSPSMSMRSTKFNDNDSKALLNKFALNKPNPDSAGILNKYSGASTSQSQKEEDIKDTDENSSARNIPVNRKNRNNLKNIEELPKINKVNINSKSEYSDLPITGALKQTRRTSFKEDLQSNIEFVDDTEDDQDEDDVQNVKFQGYLYKITQTKKLKKLWFKLLGKDLYYYKSKEDTNHKGMHNLSGVFLKEEINHKFENQLFYCFSVVYPKKSRIYYVDNDEDNQKWIKNIRKVTGYQNLTDIYDIKEKLGNGKFGLVRLGIHKQTQRKVAVKVMSKKDMSNQDLELVKTEIEILKICQHPYIVRLYDIFENLEFIYISLAIFKIVMEYCSGGDLFSYLEVRGFKLSEEKAAILIHKLSAAVFYLHSYGICHRDLKPENILMTDNTDTADIRLLDFGLSKIIGPGEVCTEPYGTLSYVAPEVLLEKPYSKAVDLWSIGIITYLLLSGCLPFDDEENEREIARQTIHDQVTYHPSTWKKLSAEAKLFVDNLLNKDPKKRMIIKDVLEHSWIQNQTKNKLSEIRRSSKDKSKSTFQIYTSVVDEKDK